MTNQTSIEKEIKILSIDQDRVIDKILKLHGENILDALTEMQWFTPNPSLLNSTTPSYSTPNKKVTRVIQAALEIYKKTGKSFPDSEIYFRLRKEGAQCDLTLKHKLTTTKGVSLNKEISAIFPSSEIPQIQKLLKNADFICIAEHQKKRISYELKLDSIRPIRVDIDTWPGIPTYLEIEGEDVDDILKVIDILELKGNITTTKLGKEFFKTYGINFYSDLKFT